MNNLKVLLSTKGNEMNEKLIEYIESSFLQPLLCNESVTDISYNGVNIFYMDNKLGRQKSDIQITSNEALDFIRQIANFSEKQFSFAIPQLDISIGKYRINAMHSSIVRVADDKACSFSIRIGSVNSRIKYDSDFIPKKVEDHLLNCLKNKESLVIAGPTGSGKTELQKYLLSKLDKNTRIIVIDNIQELENLRINDDLDITSWQISSNNSYGTIQELIRTALRSNPDWLVIAEARGKEMNEVINSVLTGHPIITTLHSNSLEDIPRRICRMVKMADIGLKKEDIYEDIYSGIRNYVFVNRVVNKDGSIERFIESVGELTSDGEMKIIYRKELKNDKN